MRSGQLFRTLVWAVASPNLTVFAFADDVLHRYEGDIHPLDPSAGWVVGNPCDAPCTESLEDGHFVFRWAVPADLAGYARIIAEPPPTLWVEWRFRSNQSLGLLSGCDGVLDLLYKSVDLVIDMFGDAAMDMSGTFVRRGLAIDEFHLFRFESLDGAHHSVMIDGQLFFTDYRPHPNTRHRLYFLGSGGGSFASRNIVNAWDFVRYGTIAFGEQVVSANPPTGSVDAREHAILDRFTVTFDSPNYVYVSDITVETTGGETPVVSATRRLDNGEPDTVEIVLDRPIPLGETTRFTMTDGVAVNIVEYTYAPGDTNGNGQVDLFDAGVLQNCFGTLNPTGLCAVSNLNRDSAITSADWAVLVALLDES